MKIAKSLSAVTGYLGANAADRVHATPEREAFPAITISRQAGARATSVGELLIERFRAKQSPSSPPWTLFGNELIQYVLRESNLPERLAKFFPEDASHSWRESVELIVGLHPSSFEINRRCHETIANLLMLGHVVIIGRCGNLLGRRMPHVLNVRLVGEADVRARHLARRRKESMKAAMAYLKREDLERKRYAKENFTIADPDDPTLYDLVVNTDRLSDAAVVEVLEEALAQKNAQALRAGELAMA